MSCAPAEVVSRSLGKPRKPPSARTMLGVEAARTRVVRNRPCRTRRDAWSCAVQGRGDSPSVTSYSGAVTKQHAGTTCRSAKPGPLSCRSTPVDVSLAGLALLAGHRLAVYLACRVTPLVFREVGPAEQWTRYDEGLPSRTGPTASAEWPSETRSTLVDGARERSEPTFPGFLYRRQPRNVYWETTISCDLACQHCRASAIPHRDPR